MSVSPFLIEVYGEDGTGKTHQTHAGSPDPIHLDTAGTDLGFRELSVDVDPERRGESWPVIYGKVYDFDEAKAESRYRYIDSYGTAEGVLADIPEYQTAILDNGADFRVLAAQHYCQVNSTDWPHRQEWGEVNNLVTEWIETVLSQGTTLVVISQMKDDYEDGDKTGDRIRDGPKNMPFDSDFRIKLEKQRTEDGGIKRNARIIKNRWLDMLGEDAGITSIGNVYDFQTLMGVSGIPESEWRMD